MVQPPENSGTRGGSCREQQQAMNIHACEAHEMKYNQFTLPNNLYTSQALAIVLIYNIHKTAIRVLVDQFDN